MARKLHHALGLVLFALANRTQVLATQTSSNPFLGVTLYRRIETSPRPLKINVAEINLTAPGIRFYMTPANGGLPEETTKQTTRSFLTQQHAQLAINASFFSVNTGAYANNSGLAASDGDVYSPMSDYHALNISEQNVPTFLRPRNVSGTYFPLPDIPLYNAMAGNQRILSSGANTATDNGIAARTAIGASQDGKHLFFFTVDGDDGGTSEGMTRIEVATMLQGYGAYNAINLDGGGSTTMAIADPNPRLLNVPSSGERAVGTNLALFALPIPEPACGMALFAVVLLTCRRSRRWP